MPAELRGPCSARPRFGPLRPVAVALLAGLVLLTACSDDDDQPAEVESYPPSDESAATGESDATGQPAEQEPDDEGGSGEVLGTTQADRPSGSAGDQDAPIPIRIDVTRLEREGELVELVLRLTNEAAAGSSLEFSPGSQFQEETSIEFDASGIGLVDGEAQMLYLPAYDSEGTCLCSRHLHEEHVQPQGSLTITATYGGVPDDVDQLDLHIPDFPVVRGVAVG